MTGRAAEVRDGPSLVGMHSRAAWLLVGFFFLTEVVLAVSSWGDVDVRWPIVVALLVVGVAGVIMLAVRPDPLPGWATMVTAAAGPVAAALVLAVVPVPTTSSAQTWPGGACAAITTYMCVRGRTPAAWASMCSFIAVCVAWSIVTGQGIGPGIAISIMNLGPLLMATIFAYTIRPAARTIYRLRVESTRRIAMRAAAAATEEEREAQLRALDRLVRPILNEVASEPALTAETKLECALLEAHLRDTLRASALVDDAVNAAARNARSRGVEVVMIDDHGLDGRDDVVRQRLLDEVVTALDRTAHGTITIRVLPPHRRLLATILINDPDDGARRIELDYEGRVPADDRDAENPSLRRPVVDADHY